MHLYVVCKYHFDPFPASPPGPYAPLGRGLCFVHYCIPSLQHNVWPQLNEWHARHWLNALTVMLTSTYLAFPKK